MPAGFYDVFAERIIENDFNDERLAAAIKYVIDNCVYPKPTIAQFISFDKRITLYTYDQILKMINENSKIFDFYKAVRVDKTQQSPIYANINDVAKYSIELWNK